MNKLCSKKGLCLFFQCSLFNQLALSGCLASRISLKSCEALSRLPTSSHVLAAFIYIFETCYSCIYTPNVTSVSTVSQQDCIKDSLLSSSWRAVRYSCPHRVVCLIMLMRFAELQLRTLRMRILVYIRSVKSTEIERGTEI